MKASGEIRRWINRMRSRYGKVNGVIDGFFLDNPWMERKDANSKKNYNRSVTKKRGDNND